LLDIGDDRQVVAIIALGYASDAPAVAPDHNRDAVDWYE
jgi:hypothetical protein